MDKRKRDDFAPPALGGSSLLVVFAVLALTVFALLSLSTVRADVRLGDAAAKAVTDYYAADTRAQEILAQLRNGQTPDDVEISTSIAQYPGGIEYTHTYAVPISDTQELQVEVLVDGADSSYRIPGWQAVSVGEWNADTTLDLWDGEIVFEW